MAKKVPALRKIPAHAQLLGVVADGPLAESELEGNLCLVEAGLEQPTNGLPRGVRVLMRRVLARDDVASSGR